MDTGHCWGLKGVLSNVYSNHFHIAAFLGPINAAKHPGSTMVGTGITPEGIEQNDVIYLLMNEMGWRSEAVDVMSWLEAYSHRRYGGMNEYAVQAWKLLGRSVYNATFGRSHTHSVIVNKPSLTLKFTEWYKPEDVWQAWDALVKAADSVGSVEPFRYRKNICILKYNKNKHLLVIKDLFIVHLIGKMNVTLFVCLTMESL